MNIEIITSQNFRKEAKKLLKKYPSLKEELEELQKQLLQNPTLGTALGHDCYKIRVVIKSKGKGKSGGARVITHLVVSILTAETRKQRIYLLTIYDKSEFESITDRDLKRLIQEAKGMQQP
jgi:hypothetical protein